jgi:hypothetical protein
MISYRVVGEEQIVENTKAKIKAAKAACKSALLKVARVSKGVSKQAVRKKSEILSKSLFEKAKVYENVVFAIVGPRVWTITVGEKTGRKRRKISRETKKGTKELTVKNSVNFQVGEIIKPHKYGHIVEAGHKKGRGRSAAKAYPFIRPGAVKAGEMLGGELKVELKQKVGG